MIKYLLFLLTVILISCIIVNKENHLYQYLLSEYPEYAKFTSNIHDIIQDTSLIDNDRLIIYRIKNPCYYCDAPYISLAVTKIGKYIINYTDYISSHKTNMDMVGLNQLINDPSITLSKQEIRDIINYHYDYKHIVGFYEYESMESLDSIVNIVCEETPKYIGNDIFCCNDYKNYINKLKESSQNNMLMTYVLGNSILFFEIDTLQETKEIVIVKESIIPNDFIISISLSNNNCNNH